ncbi:MAG: glycosyl hydrolase [Geminicoccaceae bacterium]|nr:glycosyl hydrolase [Geminicoccaceae bacterium]
MRPIPRGLGKARSTPVGPVRCLTVTTVLVGTLACERTGASGDREAAKPSAVAEVWLTTGDQAQLLARQPNLLIAVTDTTSGVPTITVDEETMFQEMVGFGGAMTDASAWLIQQRLSATQRDSLLRDLFGPEPGIGLSFTRLTIGASDFSHTHYSLDDVPPGQIDPTLARFSIEPNRRDVLPAVKQALAINPQLTVMASPWSAPAWMKTSGSLIKGTLRRDAYPAFAEYLRRYTEAYEAEGVPIFAVSLQNEPHHEPGDYPGMRLTPAQRAELLEQHVGPLFARRGIRTRILEWDHNWDEPESPLSVLADSGARTYVSGVAWHCYAGDVSAQTQVRDAHPDKDVYFTECSGGEWAPNWGDNLTWNVRTLIIGATRGWAKGVLLWNLALDENHGPHLGGCGNCRGVVTIDSATGAVTRNVEYYALAHASRFVRPGARRIESTAAIEGLESVAFRNRDETKVLLVVNAAAAERQFTVRTGRGIFASTLPAAAVATFRWH